MKEVTEHEAVVKARAKADVPVGEVGTPRAQAGAPPQDTRANRRNDYYADNGVWLFPYTFYDAGGGCGGEKIVARKTLNSFQNSYQKLFLSLTSAVGFHAGGCGGGELLNDDSILTESLLKSQPICLIFLFWY